jgi:energy-coupling factor transporter ATP-binding protein EcfA2
MQENKVTIIAFYGIDGSGKTTLAQLLMNIIKRKYTHVHLIRLRAHHTIVYLLLRFFFRIKGYDYKKLQGRPAHLSYLIKYYFRRWMSILLLLEIIGVIMWYLLRVVPRICLQRRVIFIADRFLPDFIVMLSYIGELSEKRLAHLYKFLENLQRFKPIYIYTYVNPYVAMIRKRDEDSPLSFILNLVLRYEQINRYIGHHTIDTTNKTIRESILQLLSYLRHSKIIEL